MYAGTHVRGEHAYNHVAPGGIYSRHAGAMIFKGSDRISLGQSGWWQGPRRVGDGLAMRGVRLMEQLQAGDVVRFKSGGPCMTITALGVYSGWTMRVADTVACRWCEGEKQHETVVDVALLERVVSRGARRRDRRH